MKNTSPSSAKTHNQTFSRRNLLIGSSFLTGLFASSTTLFTFGSKPASSKELDESRQDLAGWKKKKIHRIEGPGLHHFALLAYDIDASIRFYEQGFGARKRYDWNSAKTILPTGEVFNVIGRLQLMDMGDGNYVELISGGKPASERVGYDVWNHIALRCDNTDRYYERAINAGAKPYNFVYKDQVWDGRPADFEVTGSLYGQPTINVRLAYCRGIDGELIELIQGNLL
ncbi:VOC family protein [Nostoc sp. FACHB-110]|uniref:VOC family protein n=1 Tax=Nostoc sp. FACHB-110 TaxID=2692834 RepID=UPI001685027F|nr:VOC family protein [Nostoc sp. FACHB-110]MBD2435908.1 VOC family protein [Nostoc sp. FACHB-110]